MLVFELQALTAKIMVFLAGHIVAMITNCATKLTATCAQMIGQFFDTVIFASTDKERLITTHQNLRL